MDVALFNFIKTIPPFDLLPEEELMNISDQLERKVFPANTKIYTQAYSVVTHLAIITEGKIEKFFYNTQKNKENIQILQPGDTYGGISMFLNNSHSVRTVMALENTIVYLLPQNTFIALCQIYQEFSNFYTERFGRRMLDRNYATHITQKTKKEANYESSDDFFTRQIDSIYNRNLTICNIHTSIRNAASRMTAERSGCLVVENGHREFVGIITDLDLRTKVVSRGYDVSLPVSNIMAKPLITIDSKAFIYEAILLMFRKKIKHLLVVEDGVINGVITQSKLLLSQGKSPFIFIQNVVHAPGVEELHHKWQQVPSMISQLLNRGVRAEIVNKIVTTVSDTIARNIIQQTIKEMGEPPCRFMFMVYGSEGRKEQTLKTDQDNAIIYEDALPEKREGVRAYFLDFATRVNDKLSHVGFAFCEGNFMAKNPRWCHSLSHWKNNYTEWVEHSEPESVMNSIIFFDCRNIFGEQALIDELRAHIHTLMVHQVFFFRLAQNALEIKPPLTFLRNFQLINKEEHKNVLDMKRAMLPIVDFARIYALKNHINHINTGERLKALCDMGVLKEQEYIELLQAYYFMMQLRLLHQAKTISTRNGEPNNFIDPNKLSKIEKVTLKEIFKIVEKYQTKISIQFLGTL